MHATSVSAPTPRYAGTAASDDYIKIRGGGDDYIDGETLQEQRAVESGYLDRMPAPGQTIPQVWWE